MKHTGTALFLVLLAVVAITSAAVGILTAVVSQRHSIFADGIETQAELLRADAESATRAWLAIHGSGLRTPVDRPYSATRILGSRIEHKGLVVDLIVDAWDATSGVPCLGPAAKDSASLMPADVVLPSEEKSSEFGWWINASSTSRPRYPFITMLDGEPAAKPMGENISDAPLTLVASPFADGRVNWRTAPWPLVENLLQKARRLELIPILRSARGSQTTGTLTAMISQTQDIPQRDPPYLVDGTNRWIILTFVRFGQSEHRWLTVLARNSNTIICLARYVI